MKTVFLRLPGARAGVYVKGVGLMVRVTDVAAAQIQARLEADAPLSDLVEYLQGYTRWGDVPGRWKRGNSALHTYLGHDPRRIQEADDEEGAAPAPARRIV